jgi:hypothetical protein
MNAFLVLLEVPRAQAQAEPWAQPGAGLHAH